MILYASSFIFGAILASFFFTLAERSLSAGNKSFRMILFSRSRCPHCAKTVNPFFLIPIAGFFFTAGRCSCRKPVNPIYPFSETACGIMCTAMTYKNGISAETLLFSVFLCNALVISLLDIRYFKISNLSLVPSLISAAALAYISAETASGHLTVFASVTAFMILFGYIFAGGIGWGDIKLISVISLFSMPGDLAVIAETALISGSITGIVIALVKRKNLRIKIPFAPFITSGLILNYFAGDLIRIFFFTHF